MKCENIHPSISLSVCLFIHLSWFLLLNHWVEFNQTCYMTSPHGRVCDSNIIFLSIWCPSICPSRYLLLNHWEESDQTCYMTSPHGNGVQEQYYFSVWRLFVIHPSVCHAIPSQTTGWNLIKLSAWFSWLGGARASPSICPSVCHAFSNISLSVWICDGGPLTAHSTSFFFLISM